MSRGSKRRTARAFTALALAAGMLSVAPHPASAAAGALDTGWATTGKYLNDFGGSDGAAAISIQTDNKPVVSAISTDDDTTVSTSWATRFTTAGGVDGTYGTSGKTRLGLTGADTVVTSNAIDKSGGATNGYSVWAGYINQTPAPDNFDYKGFLEVLNTSGQPASGFDSDGIVIKNDSGPFISAVVQSTGKIVVLAADNDGMLPVLYRYNTDGTLDNTFGTSGKVLLNTLGAAMPSSLVADAGGNLWALVISDEANGYLYKTTANGAAGFPSSTLGKKIGDGIFPSALAASGTSVVVSAQLAQEEGDDTTAFGKYTSSGDVDTTFGSKGWSTIPLVSSFQSMLTQSDGRIVAGGYTIDPDHWALDYSLVRLTPYGALDHSFDGDGIVVTDVNNDNEDFIYAIAEDGNHKVYAAGLSGSLFDGEGATGNAEHGIFQKPNSVLDSRPASVNDVSPNAASLDTAIVRYDGDIVAPISAVPQAPTPGAVTNNDDSSATVHWTTNNNGGSPITGFTVTAWPSQKTVTVNSAVATSATLTGLVPKETYKFTIHANNAIGTGFESPESAGVLVTGPPQEPFRFTAIGRNNGKIDLVWDAPRNDGGHPVTGYELQYADGTPIAMLGASAGSRSVTALNDATQYGFRLRAINSAGNGVWGMSNKTYPVGANTGAGYYLVAADGGVFGYGTAEYKGGMAGHKLNAPIVDAALSPKGDSYWQVASDGGIFNFGDNAKYFGSMGGKPLNAPVKAIASTPTGNGYWMVATDGGVFNYGDAGFFGSMGGQHLNSPIVDVVPTPSGQGYWMVASDGGIFNFGDAGFFGSMGGQALNQPVVGLANSPSGQGYWLVARDGGVFSFGDSVFIDSMGGKKLNQPMVGIMSSPTGRGYLMFAADGGIFNYGDADWHGSAGSLKLAKPIVGAVRN